MDAKDVRRVSDLRRALKRAKPDDLLSLEALAQLWGVTKPRFVTVQKEMVGFPPPQPAPREMKLPANSHVYAAIGSLEAMIAFATRHEDAAKAKAARTAAILGTARPVADAGHHTVSELSTLARLQADTEQRQRDQGLYIPVQEVHAVSGEVFAEIAEFCASFMNQVDPHGELPPAARTRGTDKVRDLQLRLYRRMKHILAPDVVSEPDRDSANRARKPRVRRKRS